MKINNIICIILLFFSFNHSRLLSQENKVNEIEIFKMQLFLEKEIDKGLSIVKQNSLYLEYIDKINVKLELLEVSNIDKAIKFYALNARENLVLKSNLPLRDEDLFFEPRIGYNTQLIFHYNQLINS